MALSFFWTFSYSDLTTFRNQITYKFDFLINLEEIFPDDTTDK
jgi:hypothetical protein